MNKDVIYVDVDDEITSIIDKVNGSQGKVVALVLPKRSGVFQSVVNMKLLKRRAEAAQKHVVLVTSEAGLMPLAGMAGLHVAATPQSKPEIPASGLDASALDDDDEQEASLADDFDKQDNAAAPVGALAGTAATGQLNRPYDDEDTVELDNTDKAADKKSKTAPVVPAKKLSPAAAADRAFNGGKDGKSKVPNFLRFRKRIVLGVAALVLLIAGWVVANMVLPKATVTIKTDTDSVSSRFDMTLDTAAGEVDTDKRVIPAQTKQEQKSNTQTVPATGQQNKGEKASGSVKLTATMCAPNLDAPDDIPAGTGLTSNGNAYITQSGASFGLSGASGSCAKYSSGNVDIVAVKGGQASNTSGDADFSLSGTIAGKGEAKGGTDNIVKVVQQSDIDGAKQKLAAAQDQDSIKRQLQSRLEDDNLSPLPATFFAGEATVNSSSNVNDEADQVTVTQATTYTMFGAKQADLRKLVEVSLDGKFDDSKQAFQSYGLDKATYNIASPGAGPKLSAGVSLTAVLGPKIDTAKLQQQIVGKKSGEVKTLIRSNPGVTDVTVKYSPFWVTKAPKAEKITVDFEKTNGGDADGR